MKKINDSFAARMVELSFHLKELLILHEKKTLSIREQMDYAKLHTTVKQRMASLTMNNRWW